MSTLINLTDLLKHEIDDLYSAEEQIIDALPGVIEKANSAALKKALSDHLKVTRMQVKRLDKIREIMGTEPEVNEEKKGFFTRLFGEGKHKCKGTEGLIEEAKKMMGEDLTPAVLDAAIIASVQKIEHYEISGYGTAKAFAIEMNMDKVADILNETLNEEYAADDSLTALAVGRLNTKADKATTDRLENENDLSNGNSINAVRTQAIKKSAPKKSASKKQASSKAPAKKAAPQKSPAKKAAPKKVAEKSAPKKGTFKNTAVKKSAPKKVTPKKAAPKKAAPKKTPMKKSGAKSSGTNSRRRG